MTIDAPIVQVLRARRVSLLAILLALFSVILYFWSFTNEFVWDSATIILEDPSIRDFSHLPDYFSEDYYATIPAEGKNIQQMTYYRPLTKVLHLIEYSFFGPNPVGFNSVNILLNACVVAMAFILIYSIVGDLRIAFTAALLYAVNPSHVEAVSWVYSDSYILTALLSLTALFCYHGEHYLSALLVFLPALFVHEQALQLIPLLAMYELSIRREGIMSGLTRIVPFAGASILYILVRHLVGVMPPLSGQPLLNPFATAVVVIQRYVKIFFMPDALITIYPKRTFGSLSPETVFSWVVVAALIIIALVLITKKRYQTLFWYGWFFAWLTLPIMAVATSNLGDYLMADKLLYIPSLGFCVLIANAAICASKRWKRYAVLLVVMLILFQASVTYTRTLYWRTEVRYLEKAYEFAPDFYQVTYALGNKYSSILQHDKALKIFERTVLLYPFHSHAHTNIGNIYYLKGDRYHAQQAWVTAIRADPFNPMPYYNMGMLKELDGDIAGSLGMYRRYLSLVQQAPEDIRRHIISLETRREQPRKN